MIDTGRPLIGRQRELAQLGRAIGPGTDGLRVVHLTGASGIGKSTLAREAARLAAAERGFHTTIGHGRSAATSTPLAPWVEALPEIAPLVGTGRRAPDLDVLGVRVARMLERASAARPMLVVLDDAQALDESSLALLPFIGAVDARSNLTVVLVEQDDAVLAHTSWTLRLAELERQCVVQRIELGPMRDDEIRDLVAATLAEEVVTDIVVDAQAGVGIELGTGTQVPVEAVLRAEGNPWFALELAAAWRRGGGELPTSISAAATTRIATIDDPAVQDLVFAIALCPEGAHESWLDALLGEAGDVSFGEAIAAVERSGLVRRDGSTIAIVHPVMRHALVSETSAAMRRALHMELVDAIAASPIGEGSRLRALGYHYGAAGKVDEAVASFEAVAELHERAGRVHEAAADFARALDAEPRTDRRARLVRRCAFAAMQVGDERAVGYWNELGRIAAARGDNETYAFALYQQYWTSNDGARTDRLERAAALGAHRFGWAARAAACLDVLAADYSGAVAHDDVALAIARERGDAMLEAVALEKLGMSHSMLGDVERATGALRAAAQLAARERFHHIALYAHTTLAEILAEDLQTHAALAECRAALGHAEQLELHRYLPWVRAYDALALVRCGRISEARQVIDVAAADDAGGPRTQFSALVAGVRAHVAVESGDQLAGPLLDAALDVATSNGFASFVFEVRFDQARHLAQRGDLAGALAIADELEIDEPVAMARLALWLVRTALRTGLHELLDRAGAARTRVQADLPLTRLMLREVDATLAAAADCPAGVDAAADLGADAALEHVVELWKACGRPVDAMRAQTSLGLLRMRGGLDPAANALLHEAQLAFAHAGALADSDFVSSHLRSLGRGSRARTRRSVVGNLTERELQVARLVAAGMRNADVAAHLYLAENTVAAHLSNIYTKLGVRSRMLVAAWLKENDPEQRSPAAGAACA